MTAGLDWFGGRRVFVTGHTGFKGAWLCLWLQRLGAEVTGFALPAPEPGLFRLADKSPAPPDAAVRLTSGALERSNVNTVAEMGQLIDNSRQYDMAVKAMSTAQQIDAAGAKLLDIRG